jgi:hypothetical protein
VKLPKIGRILSADGDLQPLLAKTRDLRALARLVKDFLPPDLARQGRVVNFREAELVLVAANPAAAAKFRLLAPALSRYLSERRWQVNGVSVRVQPNLVHLEGAATQKSVRLSTTTLDSLKSLRNRMAEGSPARRALDELLDHHGAKSAKD